MSTYKYSLPQLPHNNRSLFHHHSRRRQYYGNAQTLSSIDCPSPEPDSLLAGKMAGNGFVIEPREIEAMCQKSGLSLLQLLASLVHPAKPLARAPISNFQVAATALGESSGRIFLGVNLEFPGLPLAHSVHAEQFLAANAASKGETALSHLVSSSSPCGHCRQFLQEIRSAPDIQIHVPESNSVSAENCPSFRPLSDLLPDRFSPDDLLHRDVPLLLELRNNRLSLNSDAADSGIDKELIESALKAANRAHAPYSNCPSGVAVRGSDGRVFSGSYIESAAYNPSLGPGQAAVISFVAGGGGKYEDIEKVVLVEKKGAAVGQESTTRLLMQSVSPGADFSVSHCYTKTRE